MTDPSIPPLADADALLRAMTKVHRRLAADLLERAADPRVEPSLREAHHDDTTRGRTGEPFETYREAFCAQVGASWILCAVFTRTLEDRGYVPHRLAGTGASDRLAQFRAQFKFLGERDYLLHVFDAMALLPGGREIFGSGHAPLWRLSPSSRAIADLLDELRAADDGVLRFTFGRPEGQEHDGASTRYLGDLYQDLNEGVRKRFALLQTPEFVERFLLDNTLDPAIRERGIAVTMIDPACGSGHLLLGAYDRLFEARRRVEPGANLEASARKALAQVHGIDLNPYAAAIARFRLLLGYLDKAGLRRLEDVSESLGIRVYVGDSLLAGWREEQETFGDVLARRGKEVEGLERGALYSFFDEDADALLAKTRFDVVVANPPYITEKDAKKRELIRERYVAAAGQYSLAMPFVERIFQIANEGAFTGQITANSFMTRDFGKPLVEQVLPRIDLTKIIDTSRANIPAHNTTVILFARARPSAASRVRVVMSNRGEATPAERGCVWRSIEAHHDDAGYEDSYITVADIERAKLCRHSWSLGGGGAASLKERLEQNAETCLGVIAQSVGFGSFSGEDEVFLGPKGWLRRLGIAERHGRELIRGEDIRDWSIMTAEEAFCPYDLVTHEPHAPTESGSYRHLWLYRSLLSATKSFAGKTKVDDKTQWWEWYRWIPQRYRAPYPLVYAYVATHNHFARGRERQVFRGGLSAPIVKLSDASTEEEHLSLLGYLNSSTACFWMRQACFPKSNAGQKHHPDPSKASFEFACTRLEAMPIPGREWLSRLTTLAAAIDRLAEARVETQGPLNDEQWPGLSADSLRFTIAERWRRWQEIREEMLVIQEELDWRVYVAFGLASAALCAREKDLVGTRCRRGDRPFERIHPRRGVVRAKGATRSLAESEVTSDTVLSPSIASLWSARETAIRDAPDLLLIETDQYKRPWRDTDANVTELDFRRARERSWLESRMFRELEATLEKWEPRSPLSVRAIANGIHQHPRVRAVAEVLSGSATYDLEELLGALLHAEAVPSAAAQRYTDAGAAKRRGWETAWANQRLQDAGASGGASAVERYEPDDFQSKTIWRHRRELDVPRERFIAYPTATPPPGATGKAGLVIGWAGWDHLQQLQAAIELWQSELGQVGHQLIPRATRAEREESLGADAGNDEALQSDAAAREKLMPILQTMADLLPWVRQWHDEDGETARDFEAYVGEEARKLEVSVDDVRAYRRPARAVGKAKKAATAPRKKSSRTKGG